MNFIFIFQVCLKLVYFCIYIGYIYLHYLHYLISGTMGLNKQIKFQEIHFSSCSEVLWDKVLIKDFVFYFQYRIIIGSKDIVKLLQ